ncbi:N-acetylgalactosamine-N, N'-diacetylbacillosaminyl-diphospho-undecaprenol 4-alpha-N-acetylgalactosaminyltransferase [Chryseobacterium aquaeductus]|uniref:N-acetylgalactosamine-N, N'-diacetylbacillosaminyl-diphospho-undecaprenol 4-alpha-N-acetylgalactosaminyltransferase n=1 Tax=Chryseobacterium aquaeductus TaxID=2675056 RepID=A0A9N8QQC9_9FLAO|nr:glycosyltransferase [Chryseobacterium aquaeductus]CAA7330506.1 N-acetylgalactosamine-N, N'-diacetylbacillosaminyl-diphospho-undecaprenol 4-alpha-N-acetylgalactosaminyltransferase [Chryseobacterium potabilaquae]CAD7804114.1 N-acetylgalactosamine-N, N'-diacetylbacillosaminyl-diphospho-undecaprenol 4-alpha-N-acetylgalactosaminyltransferase [Chryseobacterium aquaeductus]
MTEKKKILIRIGSLRHGGAEKVLVTFLKNLPEDKYEIDLLLNLYSGKYLSEVPKWINVIYINKGEMITTNRLQDIPEKAARVIFQKVLKEFPDLLYTLILKDKKYDIEFAAIHGMRDEILHSTNHSSKKIVWIHNDLSQVKEYTDEEIRKFFGFDSIMVISKKIEKIFHDLARNETEKQKIVKIYNPLDTKEILTKAEQPVINYQFDDKIPTFISVGTVFPQKGFDRLLRVHKKLLDEGFLHKILIVGDGYDFENIKNLKTELGVDDTATMLGFTDNPYPYFKNADYYILSSRYEGFPTVLFEAITLRKKIIATEVSGVNEMLNNGELGLIVENSEEGIYLGMKSAFTEPEFFSRFNVKLENYTMPFNLDHSVSRIVTVLDEL